MSKEDKACGVFKKVPNGYCEKLGGDCKYMTERGCAAYCCGRLLDADVELLSEKVRQATELVDSIKKL